MKPRDIIRQKYTAWRESADADLKRLAETTGFELAERGKGALKFARGCFMAGIAINAAMPLLVTGGLLGLAAMNGLAQTPGGQIFGANDTTTGRGIVAFLKWARNGIFLLGIFEVFYLYF